MSKTANYFRKRYLTLRFAINIMSIEADIKLFLYIFHEIFLFTGNQVVTQLFVFQEGGIHDFFGTEECAADG